MKSVWFALWANMKLLSIGAARIRCSLPRSQSCRVVWLTVERKMMPLAISKKQSGYGLTRQKNLAIRFLSQRDID